MKIRLTIKRQVQTQPDILEEKIKNYLGRNYYRIIETGTGYVTFTDDEFSDRKRFRSDFHTRIGEGKFIITASGNNETTVQLVYLTSVSYYVLVVMITSAFGIYVHNFTMPIAFSIAFALPVLFKAFYMNQNVFDEVLAS
jgi:hypothetical protein